MSKSSKTTATNRWGKAAIAAGSPGTPSSAFGAAGVVVGATLWDSGDSVLNVEITCALRLSEIRKSSFFRLVTTFPVLSRTTTRTKTRFTRTRNVGAVSRVETSEASLAGACAAGVCASLLGGGSWACTWQAAKNTTKKPFSKREDARRVSGHRNGFSNLPFVAFSSYFLAKVNTQESGSTPAGSSTIRRG